MFTNIVISMFNGYFNWFIDNCVYSVYTIYTHVERGRFNMKILLQNNSNRPIYEQIKEQIKAHILQGKIEPGASLPSMRELASDLGVSLITTKRAYVDLEQEQFVTTIRGKGTFVKSQDPSIMKEKQFIVIEDLAKELTKQAKLIGMDAKEINEIITLIYEEGE